ncbi:hypothetical protein EGW08_019931 [Elysia chlorotica]|uniref:CCHC-type domain-containing protein n=1 Tax=Elysia chlorotica TaxID=188477 RepID=A0A3S1BQD4_ELYCH|nr:hypothetical protein EGW08_019931 [Elysia chlorotica]
MRCFKCHRFGHSQTTCRRTAVCCSCGKGGHAGKDCKADPSCLNCHGPHAADSKECPKWKEEEAIQLYRAQHGGTFAQTRAAVVVELDQNIKHRAYAKATSVGTKSAQTAPPKSSGRVNITAKAQGKKSHKVDSPVKKSTVTAESRSKVKPTASPAPQRTPYGWPARLQKSKFFKMSNPHFLQWNCRGLRANYPELQHITLKHNVAAACLQETKLPPNLDFNIRDLSAYHHHSGGADGLSGGTSIFVKNTVPHRSITLSLFLLIREIVNISGKCPRMKGNTGSAPFLRTYQEFPRNSGNWGSLGAKPPLFLSQSQDLGKDWENPQNYRPIALTSCLCKLFEKMVARRLSWHLET